ncbi:MAG: rRNA pseudouridine synthase [Lachnospiraceae bacterium]|nr:rRNA pseudouridine synthase [Lachnospiraceae bacterium]
MERLDKTLSNYGGLTRSDAKQALKAGRVKVNGAVVKDPAVKAAETDEVTLDGKQLVLSKFRYFMLNKPAGYISSTEPEPGDLSPNVISLFKKEGIKGLFPVGRLDKDTTGLLIVTNDGELGHRLTIPGKHVDKTYVAKVKGELNDSAVEAFAAGFEFKEFTSAPAVLEIIETGLDSDGGECAVAKVTIHEGKFHQVKRMFQKVGCEVAELKRISMGALNLDETLKPGEYRELKPEELKNIMP